MTAHTPEKWKLEPDGRGGFWILTESPPGPSNRDNSVILSGTVNGALQDHTDGQTLQSIVDDHNALAGINPAGVAGLIEVCETIVKNKEDLTRPLTYRDDLGNDLPVGEYLTDYLLEPLVEAAQAALAATKVETE